MKRRQRDEPDANRRKDLATIRRVYREIGHWRRWTVLIFALDLLATPLALLSPVPLALAVDSVVNDKPVPDAVAWMIPGGTEASEETILIVACVLTVLFVLLGQLRSFASSVLRTVVQERSTLMLRSRMLSHAQELSFRFHDEKGTADAIYRIQYDSPSVPGIAIDGIFPFITSTVMLTAMIVVIVRIDPLLALIALAVAPALFVITLDYRRRMKSQYRAVKVLESGSLSVVHEVFSALRVVKAFGREDQESERFRAASGSAVRANVRAAGAEEVYGLLINMITAIGTALVLYFGISSVQSGQISLGSVLLVLSYLSQLYGPLQSLSRQVGKLQGRLAGAERAFDLLDEVPDVQDVASPLPLDRCRGEFHLLGVSFAYDDSRDVLHDVDLHVPAGSRVGIVGRTGAGKSTLVGLLIRFYDPKAGTISLDGIDIRRYALRDLRRQFSMVLQEPFLFSVSIRDNIAYAKPDASFAEIVAATRAAGMHDFIETLPDRYDTMVGERGMRMSGGERQRLSLARAFLKNAPILLLDEPTSSVDTDTEATIMQAMDRLMVGRTTFMIAHRLSTLESCDFVVRIENGTARLLRSARSDGRDLAVSRATRPRPAPDVVAGVRHLPAPTEVGATHRTALPAPTTGP